MSISTKTRHMSAAARAAAGLPPERGRTRAKKRRSKARRPKQTRTTVMIGDAAFSASEQAAAELVHIARVHFIRETAQVLFVFSRGRNPGDAFAVKDAWQLARELWDGKPEDC